MKTVARIVMILLAALVVVAATSVLINNGVIGAQGVGGREGERPALGEFDDDSHSHGIGRSPAGGFGEHDGGRDGAVGSFLPGLLKNLTVIAAIVALVVLSQKIGSSLSQRRAKIPGDGGDLPLVEKAPPGDM